LKIMIGIKKELSDEAGLDYLKEGLELKEDEKVVFFDDLKDKYDTMLKKFTSFEKKCKYLENQVRSLEKGKSKAKGKNKRFVGLHNTTASYENIEDDDTIPPGWKASWRLMGEGEISPGFKQKVYWAPNGRRCTSRIDAVKRMITEFSSSEEDIEIMKAGLIKDGWEPDENLPEGWMHQITKKLGRRFMSKDYDFFKHIKQAIKHISDNCTDEELVKFLIKFLLKSDVVEISWLYDDAIPFPWRAGQTKTRNGASSGQLVISPDGQVVHGFKSAYDVMEKSGEVMKADLEKFYEFITSEKFKVKPMRMKIEQSEANLSSSSPDVSSARPKNSLYWKEDGTVPKGWKYAIPEGECFGKKFKDPSGKFFPSRLEAMRSMMKNNETMDNNDLDIMKEGLVSDGWSTNESLPSGWFCRKIGGTKSSKQYVTRNLEIVDKMETVIKHMRDNNYSEEEMNRFLEGNGLQWKTDEDLPDGWRYGIYNNVKQGQLKNYMDPSGKFYGSIAQILKYFLEVDPHGADMEKTKKYLLKDGWFVTDLLPPGWYIKQKKSEHGFYYLTPTFDKFHATTTAIQHLKDLKWDENKILKFEMNHKSLAVKEITKRKRIRNSVSSESEAIQTKEVPEEENGNSDTDDDDTEDDEEVGLIWEDDLFLPRGWKVATTVLSTGKCAGTVFKRYMSPCGNHFGNLADALRFLVEEGSTPESEINQLKQGLSYEGWAREESFPEGWLSKESISKRKCYLSPSLETFSDIEDVVQYMKNNGYKDDEIEGIAARQYPAGPKLKTRKEPAKSAKSENLNVPREGTANSSPDWLDDPGLPAGWKLAWYETANGEKKSKYLKYRNPGGRILNSRAQAVRNMLQEGTSSEEVEKMKSGFFSDGWMSVDFLPAGWMCRKSSNRVNFLTPSFEAFKTAKQAVEYMENQNYDSEVLAQFQTTDFNRLLDVNDDGIKRQDAVKRRKESEENIGSQPKILKMEKIDDELWRDGDASLPKGWKVSTDNLRTNGYEFKSTKGHTFKTRVEGLKFMIEHRGIYTTEEVEDMEKTLEHEGWILDSLLPKNWRLKKIGTEVHFLSGIFTILTTLKSARASLKKNFGSQEIDNFSKLAGLLKPSNTGWSQKPDSPNSVLIKFEPVDPLDEHDTGAISAKKIKTEHKADNYNLNAVKKEVIEEPVNEVDIPQDWKSEVDENGDENLINSEGTRFNSRVSAVQFMMRNNYDPKIIYNLWSTLDKQGWTIPNERIPSGWRIKYFQGVYDYKYLTKDMKHLDSTQEAFTYVKDSGEFNHIAVIRFESWANEVKKTTPEISWTTDPALPSSWRISSGMPKEIIKNGKGALFEGRKESIDHMIKEKYSPTDIFKLWNTLHLDGWVTDENNLPTGWKRKSEKNTYHYLSPMMEVVKTGEALLDIVRKGRDYSEEEVKRVEKWLTK